jgi:transcriptional regulator with XRE-family HTH domain
VPTLTPPRPKYILMRHFLLDARVRAGITQRALAAALDKAQAYVQKYESGKQRITIAQFHRICGVLGVSAETQTMRLLQPADPGLSQLRTMSRARRCG